MNKVCVIAPHPDDETLGCGGTILKHKKLKDKINWICVTSMKASNLWNKKNIERRDKEINMVIKAYGFDSFQSLDFLKKYYDEPYSTNHTIERPFVELYSDSGRIFKHTK